MRRTSKSTQSPRVDGISPVKRLLEILMLPIFMRLPMSIGTGPEKKLFDKSKLFESEEILKISRGMFPSKEL
jgi:hypothetical protein